MKVNREPLNDYTGLSGRYESLDVFRGEHPDTRSNREAIKAIEEKLGLRVTKKQWYPRRRQQHETMMRPVICTTTGQRFAGIRKAAIVLGLEASNICSHLKGRYPHVCGYEFKYE